MNIPKNHHIARYCAPKHIDENGDVEGSAFILSDRDDYLSVSWLEYLNRHDRNQEIIELRKIYDLISLGAYAKAKKDAKIAVLNVGSVYNKVLEESEDNRRLAFYHKPTPPCYLCHSGIYNLRKDDNEIALLIRQTILESHPRS